MKPPALILLVLALILVNFGHSQTINSFRQNSQRCPPIIQVEPAILEFNGVPGTITSEVFTIFNIAEIGCDNLNFNLEIEYSNQNTKTNNFDTILIEEHFTGGIIPEGWSVIGMGESNWSVENTFHAGGASPELQLSWSPSFMGATYMASPVLNTEGLTSLTLNFTHFVDWYENNFTVGVATSGDGGATWYPAWSVMPSGNIGPESKTITIIDNNVGSADFIFAFFFDGNSINLDYWYIDDVVLTGTDVIPPDWLSVIPISGAITSGQSLNLTATCDLSNFPVGPYAATIKILSDDPVTPLLNLPVVVIPTLTGPVIFVQPASIYVEVEMGQTLNTSMMIGNIGDEILTFNISTPTEPGKTNDWFAIDPTAGMVYPGSVIDVNLQFFSGTLPNGTYSTEIIIANNSPVNPVIIPVTMVITGCSLPPPVNLTVQIYGITLVYLQWEPPETDDWLEWDDGANFDNIGLTSGGTFIAAARWLPVHISQYDGEYLKRISLYLNENTPGVTYTLKVWKGENASILLYSQLLSDIVDQQWNTFSLNPPVQVDGTQELWVGYEVTHPAGTEPAGVDDGPAIAGLGDKVFYNGTWGNLSGFGLNSNWNIKANIFEVDSLDYILLGYNAYVSWDYENNFVKMNQNIITETSYQTFLNPPFMRKFYVTAVYDICESDPSNLAYTPVSADDNPNDHQTLTISPNPANDYLNVQAAELIERIFIFDVHGKNLLSISVNSNQTLVDVSGIPAGLYYLRAETERSFYAKKFIIR